MTEQHMRALFTLAGIEVRDCWRLDNRYWPDAYVEERRNSPWWLVKTDAGMVVIGWRKRVIAIDWSDTGCQGILTKDEVTKAETHVHAWGYAKAVEYLAALRLLFSGGAHRPENPALAPAAS